MTSLKVSRRAASLCFEKSSPVFDHVASHEEGNSEQEGLQKARLQQPREFASRRGFISNEAQQPLGNVLATRFGQPPASATVFSPFFHAT